VKRLRSPRAVPQVRRPAALLEVALPLRADRARGVRRPPGRLAPQVIEAPPVPLEIEVLAARVETVVPARRVRIEEIEEIEEIVAIARRARR